MTHKHLLLASAAVITCMASLPAFAQNSTQSPHSDMYVSDRSGVYAGGFGGFNWTDVDTGGANANLSGGDYGVFLGYQLDAMFTNMDIGLNGSIEAHYAWSDSDDTITVAGVPVNVEKNNEWGISFRPGLTFIDEFTAPIGIKPYGIIGYKQAEFEATGGGFTGDETYDGFELGIGTELIAFNDFGVRADYAHTWYGEENGIDPEEDTLRLGIAYHF